MIDRLAMRSIIRSSAARSVSKLAVFRRDTKRLFSVSAPSNISATPARRSVFELSTLVVAATSAVAGAALAYRYSPFELSAFFLPRLPAPGSAEEVKFIQKVEDELQSSAMVGKMRKENDYVERRMWMDIPETYRDSGFLSGTLKGPGKFAVPGIVFVNEKENKVVSVIHCGWQLSGFPGIVVSIL